MIFTLLVAFRGFWGCLGVQMSVLELKITFFHLRRPLFGQGPRMGDIPQNTPKSKIAHIAVYSDFMVMGRGCNPLGVFEGVWGCLGAHMRVFAFKITILHPARALGNGQIHPK